MEEIVERNKKKLASQAETRRQNLAKFTSQISAIRNQQKAKID